MCRWAPGRLKSNFLPARQDEGLIGRCHLILNNTKKCSTSYHLSLWSRFILSCLWASVNVCWMDDWWQLCQWEGLSTTICPWPVLSCLLLLCLFIPSFFFTTAYWDIISIPYNLSIYHNHPSAVFSSMVFNVVTVVVHDHNQLYSISSLLRRATSNPWTVTAHFPH